MYNHLDMGFSCLDFVNSSLKFVEMEIIFMERQFHPRRYIKT